LKSQYRLRRRLYRILTRTGTEERPINPHTILIIEDDVHFVALQKALLLEAGYAVETVTHPKDANAAINKACPDLILLDLTFQGSQQPGLGFLEEALSAHPMLHIIVISSHDQSPLIIKALDLGAMDYIVKDDTIFDFLSFRVAQAFERIASEKQLRQSVEIHGGFVFGPGKILVGRSPAMLEVYDLIARVSEKKINALILGESGTGKEVVADAIHSKKLIGALCFYRLWRLAQRSLGERVIWGPRKLSRHAQ